jgi:hypothetical protein
MMLRKWRFACLSRLWNIVDYCRASIRARVWLIKKGRMGLRPVGGADGAAAAGAS